MKRLILILLLVTLLLSGCMIANGTELDTVPSDLAITETAPQTEPTQVPETEAPEPPDRLTGVEVELPQGLSVTAERPLLTVTVRLSRAALPAAAERTGDLTLYLDGEPVAEWTALPLEAGTELRAKVPVSFVRYQPDRMALLTATLRRGSETRTWETRVALCNAPDEVYARASGDSCPYSIDVLRNQNLVIVYGRDDEGGYTVPVKVWLRSTGYTTPRGEYRLGNKRAWGSLFGGVYGQYVSAITGDILFHSVPYTRPEKDHLKTEEYNKLGTTCSMGCVRLAVEGAKWIFDNCPTGTAVHIYDTQELPVERPAALQLDPEDPRSGWDPTDPDLENPWIIDN